MRGALWPSRKHLFLWWERWGLALGHRLKDPEDATYQLQFASLSQFFGFSTNFSFTIMASQLKEAPFPSPHPPHSNTSSPVTPFFIIAVAPYYTEVEQLQKRVPRTSLAPWTLKYVRSKWMNPAWRGIYFAGKLVDGGPLGFPLIAYWLWYTLWPTVIGSPHFSHCPWIEQRFGAHQGGPRFLDIN